MPTRSEHRFRAPLVVPSAPDAVSTTPLRHLRTSDREALAQLLLDAYRGTIDDEGEDLADALDAADDFLARGSHEHSFTLDGTDRGGDRLDAVSIVALVDGRHYVDLVAVSAERKRRGLGRRLVSASIASVVDVGATELGAVITDGNTASERLFAGLGFDRFGPWPPEAGDPVDRVDGR